MQEMIEFREFCVKRAFRCTIFEISYRLFQILTGHKTNMVPQPVVLKVIRRGQRSLCLCIQRCRDLADLGGSVPVLDPRCVNRNGDDLVLRQHIWLSLDLQVVIAAVAVVVVLPIRVQFL